MKPTFAFDKGVLHIASSGADMRLRWQPVPLAERQSAGGKWLSFRPEFRILAPESPALALPDNSEDQKALAAKKEAFHAFRAEVPPAIVEVAESFGSYQWPLMLLAGECQGGLDLARSNPVLAYALANNEHFRSTPGAVADFQAVRYCHRKQRQILKWLGFPDSEAVVKVMRKVLPEVAHPGTIRLLRKACLVPETLKRMGHLPVINRGIIFMLSDAIRAGLATPALLQEISMAGNELDQAPTADLVLDIHCMAVEMRTAAKLRPFASRRQVRECYDRTFAAHGVALEQMRLEAERLEQNRRVEAARCQQVQRTERKRDRLENAKRSQQESRLRDEEAKKSERLRLGVFPPPPIPGTDTIIPLRNRRELWAEGAAQMNCLRSNQSYTDRVILGELYIYRVTAPVRCTLSIMRYTDSTWGISEVRRACNAEVSQATKAHIMAWLSAHQVSL